MKSQSKSNKHALDVLARADINQSVIDSIEKKHRDIKETLEQERQLYLDLANAQPTGVYRLRAFSATKCNETKWRSSLDAPYIVEFANTRFCELINIGLEKFQKNPAVINDLIFEPDKENFIQKNIESNKYLIPFVWEGRLYVRNEIIWGHFESTPRPLPNGDVIWTGAFFDITKRKKEQQEIQDKNRELQLVNAEKDKFFSIIAHDLKSPFNAIIGFTNLLLDEIRLNNIEGIEKYAEIVLDSSNTAFDLLTNLMSWSCSQTGRLTYKPESFDMLELINESKNVFSHIAEGKKIDIRVDIDAELPVCADISMISTVLRNLISNAIKFTHTGGQIIIRSEQLEHHLKVVVSDSGIGINESVIDKLFRIDEKHSTIGTHNEQGTGLGLILCKDFVERHEGQIWAESAEGIGSCFIFTIKNPRS
ncbi:ATP-binding protein [Ancylomarina sp.]|uniref:PAS domain-containing sensor histidine kinase n=1 Tax=Ancylomarina sp. TaxID=1970196 RepID=UPI003564AB47